MSQLLILLFPFLCIRTFLCNMAKLIWWSFWLWCPKSACYIVIIVKLKHGGDFKGALSFWRSISDAFVQGGFLWKNVFFSPLHYPYSFLCLLLLIRHQSFEPGIHDNDKLACYWQFLQHFIKSFLFHIFLHIHPTGNATGFWYNVSYSFAHKLFKFSNFFFWNNIIQGWCLIRSLWRLESTILKMECRILFLYFGINAMWYWRFHRVCDKLLLSIWTASFDFEFGLRHHSHHITGGFILLSSPSPLIPFSPA